MTITILEPQCAGFSHVAFNAALLSTALLAYPEDDVIFAAEREHLQWVKAALADHRDVPLERVQWREIEIPPQSLDGRRRLPHEWSRCRELAEMTSRPGTRCALLSSVTDAGLFALSSSMRAL